MVRLSNITLELHGIGLFKGHVILGTVTVNVNVHTLYPDGVKGFFGITPTGTSGGWRSINDSCAVCEVSFAPESPPAAPPFSLEALFSVSGPCTAQATQAFTGPQPQVAIGAEPSPPYSEAQGEEAEADAKAPPIVKDPPTKAPQTWAQSVQQVHGPKVDMRQQPLAQPVEPISPTQQFHVPAVLAQTPAQMRGSFVKQHLHELAVDLAISERIAWQGFDRLNKSLLEGCHMPGLVRGHPASVQGIALGFPWSSTTL